MGCTSSITAAEKIHRQNPNIQINVIEPSTAVSTTTRTGTPPSPRCVRAPPALRSVALQVSERRRAGRCQSALSHTGEVGGRVPCERRKRFSEGSWGNRNGSLSSTCLASGQSPGWRGAGRKATSQEELSQSRKAER
ncbi:hypothetical protein HHUSO_G14931 [Huso huso]|uniref:Uncharacterized protein n=1 Tax=Huso huso TaxID=61971 RepID=A0ABR0ZFB7_HUSHU